MDDASVFIIVLYLLRNLKSVLEPWMATWQNGCQQLLPGKWLFDLSVWHRLQAPRENMVNSFGLCDPWGR